MAGASPSSRPQEWTQPKSWPRISTFRVDDATLECLRITVEWLCCEYPYTEAQELLAESKQWLSRMISLLDGPLTLSQRREILSSAGWLAALVGCLEYDCANRTAAEASRQTAWNLAEQSGDTEIMAWSQEMLAWFALTHGDFCSVLDAAETGHAMAPRTGAAVQLHAQKAKAWARLGDRRQAEAALDHGRVLLERLPRRHRLDNHFTTDPAKWDFYAMDCRRVLDRGRAGVIRAFGQLFVLRRNKAG